MTETVEMRPNRPLHDLLSLYSGTGVEDVRQMAALKVEEIESGDAKLLGKTVAEWAVADIGDELRRAFELDPFALLAGAWGQVRKVRKSIDASRGPPARTETIALVKHDIEASIEPRLVLCVEGVDWCSVKLALGLSFSFDFVQLEIADGRLRALKLGAPAGSVTLKCQGREIAAFKRTLSLEAAYAFDPPLAFPGT